MTKKTSEKLTKIYKPFTIISIASILTFAVNATLTLFWGDESAIYEFFELVFGALGIGFGYIGAMGVVPAVVSAILIVISAVFAVKEKNNKNVLNLRLWLTVTLLIAGGFLNFLFLDGMV